MIITCWASSDWLIWACPIPCPSLILFTLCKTRLEHWCHVSSQTLLLFHLQKNLTLQSAAWFTGGLWEILSGGGNVEPEWWWRNVLRSEQGLAISVRWDSWQKGLSRKNRLVTEGREEWSVLRPWDVVLSHPQEKKQPNFWRTWRRKGWYSCKWENGDEGTQRTLRPWAMGRISSACTWERLPQMSTFLPVKWGRWHSSSQLRSKRLYEMPKWDGAGGQGALPALNLEEMVTTFALWLELQTKEDRDSGTGSWALRG